MGRPVLGVESVWLGVGEVVVVTGAAVEDDAATSLVTSTMFVMHLGENVLTRHQSRCCLVGNDVVDCRWG